MKPSLSIVVPALNEAKNIAATYTEIASALAMASVRDYEILFIDDHSEDGTLSEMQAVAAQDRSVRCFHNEVNLGLGGTYKKGVGLASKQYYMLVPGDNVWPADGLAEILNHLGKKDIIIPFIMVAGDKGPIRKFLSKGFTTLVNVLFGLRVSYYNGVVIHNLENLRKIKIVTNSFAYQAEALVKLLKMGFSYEECGLNTVPRSDGKSKALKIGNLVRVVATVFGLRWKLLIHGKELYRY